MGGFQTLQVRFGRPLQGGKVGMVLALDRQRQAVEVELAVEVFLLVVQHAGEVVVCFDHLRLAELIGSS